MNKCKQCGVELTGKKTYCNDACRMAFKRTTRTQPEQEPEQKDQPEQAITRTITPNTQPEQEKATNPNIVGRNGYHLGQVLTNRVFEGVKWPDRTVGICRACELEIDREANPEWDILDKCPKCSWATPDHVYQAQKNDSRWWCKKHDNWNDQCGC